MSVAVLGSANLDLVYRVSTLPAPGETIMATGRTQHLGGKGNNQAIAAARAGAEVSFVAAVGDDEAGTLITSGLTEAGAASVLRTGGLPTGTALIMVDDHGENSIVVDPGANSEMTDLTDDERTVIAEASILLLQLEIPVSTVTAAAWHAQQAGTVVVLNGAPMSDLPAELLEAVDLLIINETEAQQLTGRSDPEAALTALLSTVDRVIVTVGAQGALTATADEGVGTVPGYRVPVTDTTGAGDTFCGALVAELDRQRVGGGQLELAAATHFATRAAALSVQRIGAVGSIPTRAEIDAFTD